MTANLNSKLDVVDLSFGLESNASLWSIVFKGFDEEVTLISRFQGSGQLSVETLKRFGNIIMEKYRGLHLTLVQMRDQPHPILNSN